ncbi:hypothetical protein CQ12_41165 [Bradyrhizobium jicamae]|uniref:Uncharacterized protein n=1 Tax=Bradyrhizobium jicamae TaxID=280332 RepID=A0A0R3LSG5_9BRAD|nr:hypothetical protein CQ12_41165 [Bradyrhizobium jicamae]
MMGSMAERRRRTYKVFSLRTLDKASAPSGLTVGLALVFMVGSLRVEQSTSNTAATAVRDSTLADCPRSIR